MIPQDIAEQIKERANVKEVVGDYVKLSKSGNDYVGKCPFHDEKTPSFKVSTDKKMFKCFGCGASGDSVSFVMKHEKLQYLDALRLLAKKYFIEIPEPDRKKEIKRPTAPTVKELPKLLKWFFERGISQDTIKHFGITFTTEWMPKAQKETETICFNYYRDSELINIKFRAAQKDFKLAKDAELIFYNLDSIKGRDYVIIVEGEVDCLTVSQCFDNNTAVVSVPNGAAAGSQRLEYLDNCWHHFNEVSQVIIFTDNDHPGILLRDELARRIGIDKCLKVVYPADCKDANEMFLRHGKEKVLEVIKNAVEFPIEGIITMNDMYDDIRDFYDNGYPMGVQVGIPVLDDHISFMSGQITIVTGIPSSGKSEFLDNIIVSLAKNHEWGFGICSFENQPSSLHVTKLMEKYVGKSFMRRFNPYNRINEDEFNNATIFVHSYFHFININQIDVTLDGILDKAKELVKIKGIKGLVIDPWNYIEHKIGFGQSETNYISESLSKIKGFALKYGVHVFLIAHPAKLRKEGGKYEIPTLYSISGSAHFFNKTDNGLTVYRNFDEQNTVDVHIQKIRYSWLGKVGLVSFAYNTETRQYEILMK